MKKFDVIIIGAGAAGLMCAIEAGKRNRSVLVLDHANKVGKKILMSGGGRCNFTNFHTTHENYISQNPHFCKSALSRYTQWDFIALVNKYKIPFHEKTLGQLFCDNKAQDIVNMLLAECEKAGVSIQLHTRITTVSQKGTQLFSIQTEQEKLQCESLVIATGGLSIPTMGASPFGYKIAEQFALKVWPTRAGLVPFTLQPADKARLDSLSGVAVTSEVSSLRRRFDENILFTHRGLSGPAVLQISSYWEPGEEIVINLLPKLDLLHLLKNAKQNRSQVMLKTQLLEYLPKSVLAALLPSELAEQPLPAISHKQCAETADLLHQWTIKPNGTEGYRTAEVTLGGVDTAALSSKTMEVRDVPGLYFIGEVVDVTGWLGGFNFQWAWSSAWAAGQVV
ncbi:MAG: NAD(P)/FAD-dependent oxidoreductase [Legionellales bacterium]|nr:NAD(P)/FAD-dependent oxidoreductase [Legionellales bacterium]